MATDPTTTVTSARGSPLVLSISPSAGPSGREKLAAPGAMAWKVAVKRPASVPAGEVLESRNHPILLTLPATLAADR